MYIFIDESGTHIQEGHSTASLVYIKTEDTDKINDAILRMEKEYKIEPFHWRKQSWKIRQAFLEAVIKEAFEVKILLIENPFTEEKFENALKYLLVERHIQNIVIDGKKPPRHVLRLKKILRDFGISVKKIRMGNDRSFPCLRLADLFAGLVRVHFEGHENVWATKLYQIAKIKITTLAGGQEAD